MADRFLTPEEWEDVRADSGSWIDTDADIAYERLRAHDAALRSRLAEVEAKLDHERRRVARYLGSHAAAVEAADQRDAAEARLAEAIELLRGLIDSPDDIDPRLRYIMLQPDREDVDAARAFIEAHGEGA